MQLERIVQSAGMVEHCDFTTQASVMTDDGVKRPDLVVRLAGGKNVVVDAKVAFSGYLEAMEARDDATRTARLRAHARHLRDHIDGLGKKSYWEQFQPTPEFVVMFVPAEVFLSAALEEDPTLFEHAFERNVVIATPQTLIAMLRTIAYTWRQEALAANAQQVYELGRELHGRLATMGTHLAKLGSGIDGAVKAYNQTISSLESRVLVTARRLTELKVVDETLVTPPQIESATRQLEAPELVASATDALVSLDPVVGQIEADPRYGVDSDTTPGLFTLPRTATNRGGGA
jgi:DNA recombination protein RmuC